MRLTLNPEKTIALAEEGTLSKEQWFELRRSGIGGSDVGTILGLSNHSDAEILAKQKLGMIPRKELDVATKARFAAGQAMEPVILSLFKSITGLTTFTDKRMFQSVEHPFMIADCDGFCIDDNGTFCGVEAKYISPDRLQYWHSGIYHEEETKVKVLNEGYIAQCQHYMAVMDMPSWYLVVWAGNDANDLVIIKVNRNEYDEKELIKKESQFWYYVSQGTWPTVPHNDENFKKLAEATFEAEPVKPDSIEINTEYVDYKQAAQRLLQINEQKSDLKKREKMFDDESNQLKLALIEALESHQIGTISDDSSVITISYKAPKDKTVVDLAKLEKVHPDIYLSLINDGTISAVPQSRRFTIKQRNI